MHDTYAAHQHEETSIRCRLCSAVGFPSLKSFLMKLLAKKTEEIKALATHCCRRTSSKQAPKSSKVSANEQAMAMVHLTPIQHTRQRECTHGYERKRITFL